ncbi:hypothetical protein BpHYR1_037518 [Brachionus plicatilis]|uniref:Transmembrane protein 272-like n=1 Tax=Brachionus plicatilis TaxID=10195 RepID=A0A3M7S087_BRAPC|nr:hypothetical protein BpHYR1_037518 [Brachionus plicatilis]
MAEAPVYDPVSTDENEEKPPSYFNVISQIKHAKSEAKSPADLGLRTLKILAGSFFFSIILVISSVIPIAMLIIGVISQEKCSIQSKIPLWLIVMGVGGVVSASLKFLGSMITCIKSRKDRKYSEPKILSCFNGILSLFLFIWFILGNYWVYSIYDKVQYDSLVDPETYCDKLCYLFSFWSITTTWILLGLSCLCSCVLVCVVVGISAKVLTSQTE